MNERTGSPVVAFIGGGNMASSLVGGMVARGGDPSRIRVADRNAPNRERLCASFGVQCFATPEEAVDGADFWVLAVKPQGMRVVCNDLAPLAQQVRPVAVSVAAGITSRQVADWLGGAVPVVRAMPNTPSLLGAGMTGLYANEHVEEHQRAQAGELLAAVGEVEWIADEALMDAVTGVSGSGPAYLFLMAEAMADAGAAQGLPRDVAARLANQTILGAARMLVESGEDAATLRRRVTSPGGTTQAGLEAFEEGGLRALVERAVGAATRRGAELSAANEH